MLWKRMLMNPLSIVTKQISGLGVSVTGRMIKRLLFILPLPMLSHLVFSQESFSWIGQKVVAKYGHPIKIGEQLVEQHNFHVYTVQRANGDWLWVVSGSKEGWIPASQVVLFDQAINFYTQEIAANPGNSWAWAGRGQIWKEKKEYDKAIADVNEAIRLDPKYAAAYNNRGNAWSEKKEYDKAIADYNEVIRLDPGIALAYRNRGAAWQAKKDYDKAIADFNEAIRLDPTDAIAYYNRGNAWQAKKDYDKAIDDYTEAIRLDPGIAPAYDNRGNAWRVRKNYDKAIADYTEAIRLDPKYAYGKLAWLRATRPEESLRDGKKAIEFATRGCELTEWKDANMLGTLAAGYAEVGDFDKAVEWEEKAIQLYASADDRKKGEERLKLYKDKKPYRETE